MKEIVPNSVIPGLVDRHRHYFATGKTIDPEFRRESLIRLHQNIKKYEKDISRALNKDLGKSEFEAFSTEIGMVLHELSFHIKKLKSWARPQRVRTPLFAWPSKSYIHKQPYGTVLVISPFNYPFMLAMTPLIAAVSAGNSVALKPSEYIVETTKIIERLVQETFGEGHVSVVKGGIEESRQLLAERWDKIFFTGSTKVGKIILEAASKYLTPVVLELGGKNPAIVDQEANLNIAARRIIWGKLINAGQTCIAPDYVLVHSSVKEQFQKTMVEVIEQFFSEHPDLNKDFPAIVNERAIERLIAMMEGSHIFYGGKVNSETRHFSPTLLTDVSFDSAVMQDEIFGPILPIIGFDSLEKAIEQINKGEKPLSLYYFSEDKKKQKEVLKRTYSGDAGVNEVVMHFTNLSLPFGGVGYSGMGSYHGKRSFDVFTHERSVMKTSTWIDIPLRYPPYKNSVLKLLRLLFK